MNEGTERVFRASLEPGGAALGWTVAHVPFDPLSAWPQRVRLRVKGEMRGPKGSLAFRSSLFAGSVLTGGRQGFYLLINKRMLAASGTATGTEAEFRLLPDLEERPAELPEELDALLDEADGLRAWYGDLSEYTRREIGKWLGLANGVEARLRRAGQMAERLLSTMEVSRRFGYEMKARFKEDWCLCDVCATLLGLSQTVSACTRGENVCGMRLRGSCRVADMGGATPLFARETAQRRAHPGPTRPVAPGQSYPVCMRFVPVRFSAELTPSLCPLYRFERPP